MGGAASKEDVKLGRSPTAVSSVVPLTSTSSNVKQIRSSMDSLLLLKSLSMITSSRTTTRCDAGAGGIDAPPLPPVPGTEAPPLPEQPSSSSSSSDAIAQAAQSTSLYANPGPYEQVSMDAKRLVQLDTFDGFRCDINKQVSPYMAAVHSFWLGTNMIQDGTNRTSTYTFTTQVADEAGIVMGRADPGRVSLDGQVHRALFGGLAMGKVQFGVAADGQSDQLFTELVFGGNSWTANLKYGSVGGGIMYGCNYLQAITPRVAMGGEGLYVDANQSMIGNYSLRFSIPAKTGDEQQLPVIAKNAGPGPAAAPFSPPQGDSTFCINFNPSQAACVVNYKRVVTPNRVTLGAELSFSPMTLESSVLVGAEFKLQRSKVNICLDPSSYRIQSLLEAKLGMAPGSPTLQFSAEMDHYDEKMRFGYGITVDG